MAKNARLADIYVKIYNGYAITMDDLAFLAEYDPECFEKTCRNLVYNEPEVENLLDSRPRRIKKAVPKPEVIEKPNEISTVTEADFQKKMQRAAQNEKINTLFENLKKMEGQESGLQKLNVDNVKHLLGSLFMEMLFPHDDKEKTFEMADDERFSTFNTKI